MPAQQRSKINQRIADRQQSWMPAKFSHRLFNLFFFFNDTATTEIYTLSLHDALPIFAPPPGRSVVHSSRAPSNSGEQPYAWSEDRKSTRLNSSHLVISYAVFCLK